jgi:hypothetical protein
VEKAEKLKILLKSFFLFLTIQQQKISITLISELSGELVNDKNYKSYLRSVQKFLIYTQKGIISGSLSNGETFDSFLFLYTFV